MSLHKAFFLNLTPLTFLPDCSITGWCHSFEFPFLYFGIWLYSLEIYDWQDVSSIGGNDNKTELKWLPELN